MDTITTTGRRKQAVARVRVNSGSGTIKANGRDFDDYFPSSVHRQLITEPLRVAGREEEFHIDVTLHGGGLSGQAGAFRLGITRAMVELDPEIRGALKAEGLLTRDPRKKESKKYGLKKARKAPQYSKR